jgi:hypothetical protein
LRGLGFIDISEPDSVSVHLESIDRFRGKIKWKKLEPVDRKLGEF